ncbi:hypothetical protein I4U23_000819 [Adineta vaga]|nr:hypothetical protein I4U23_000819 [Adineta vaga]
MNRASVLIIVTFLLHQCVHIIEGVTCASNPCQLVPGVFDSFTGYCCNDLPPSYNTVLCTCPNNIQSVVNAPCRAVNPFQAACAKTCVNSGVCNVVNGQQVCWCQLGFSGEHCEIQGMATRCYAGLCQSGTCYEQTIGASTYAYCHCTPGYRGVNCNQCYFTCTRQGVFPDTAQCGIGRYFYCPQPFGTPIGAVCPIGQKFNRFTSQCDSTYQCT